ncbi:MAG: thioredoxin-disulfide reductase [Deltaproteobacteria bacterium]|nr:MAG: thioredoxin-disulfide reductase [Deltaproteobacteria bacterium]
MQENENSFDVLIIGGGPAGLTAGLYAARARMKCVLLEKMMMGGQIATTEMVDNYPGFPEGIAGAQIGPLFETQAKRFGLEVRQFQEGLTVERKDQGFLVTCANRDELFCKSLIVATGSGWTPLGIPGEESLKGAGVSYCATCDGAFFRDQELAVIGGGNSAIEEALFLTKFASKVYVIHRRDQLRAEKIVQEKAFANPKIEFVWSHIPLEIVGEKEVEGVRVKDLKNEEERILPVAGVFIYVGMKADSDIIKDLVEVDAQGYIKAAEDTATSCPGLFAAGDVRQKPLRQVATAIADGATAAIMAEKYIDQ